MYTVLIQSKKTQESFLRFHPLLAASLEKKAIGACQWVPSGATLDTALPELYELVRYKAAWRAVILRTEEDLEDGRTRGNNPYDYLKEEDRSGLIREDGKIRDRSSDLIRLTHLLGGIPAPEPTFVKELKYDESVQPAEDGREKLSIRKLTLSLDETEAEGQPEEDLKQEEQKLDFKEKKELHRQWEEANEPRITRPREILLVTASEQCATDEALARIRRPWYDSRISDAEDFANRNHYPHSCRFLVYPMKRGGAVNREKESFLMWTALAVLMLNPTNSDSLQPRRLYRFSVRTDQKALHETLQLAYDRLEHADEALRDAMVRRQKEEESVHPGIPNYRVEVPVVFAPEAGDAFEPDLSQFELTAELPEDLEYWRDYTDRSVAELARMLHDAERHLDQSTERMRRASRYSDEEVYSLSEYQQEDLRESLDRDYQSMLDNQARLPSGTTDIRERADEANQAVRNGILRRINGAQALRALCIPIALLLAAFAAGYAPGVEVRYLLAAAGISALLCGAALLAVLLVRRGALLRLAAAYEGLMLAMSEELNRNAGAFTQFLSSVASHIHGCSYLDVMIRKQNAHDSDYYNKLRRRKAFELLMNKLRGWSAACGEELSGARRAELDSEDYLEYDDDHLFSLQDPEGSSVELNRTGVMLNTPFRFVTAMEIRREEIVDDE